MRRPSQLWHLPATATLAAPTLAIGVSFPELVPVLGVLTLLFVGPSIGMAVWLDGDFRRYFGIERSRSGTAEAILVRSLWSILVLFLAITVTVALLAALAVIFLLLPGPKLPAPS